MTRATKTDTRASYLVRVFLAGGKSVDARDGLVLAAARNLAASASHRHGVSKASIFRVAASGAHAFVEAWKNGSKV